MREVVFMHWAGYDMDEKAIGERARNRTKWRTHGKTTPYSTDWEQSKTDSRRAATSGRSRAAGGQGLRRVERGANSRTGAAVRGNLGTTAMRESDDCPCLFSLFSA
jgi:hypothetical protein